MKFTFRIAAALCVVALAACSGGGGVTPSTGTQAMPVLQNNVRAACGGPVIEGFARCFALIRTDVGGSPPARRSAVRRKAMVVGHRTVSASVAPNANGGPAGGYGPTDLQSAYNLPTTGGAGQTVAIVDAYDDPNAESDLNTYRSYFGLAACTSANGCFRKVDQNGGTTYPAANSGWAGEISLDLDMVSAACASCNIVLVEANSASYADLDTAENRAAALGATEISNSFGGGEVNAGDNAYNHAGIAITASAGDSGTGASQPCSYSTVVCVGGTTLSSDPYYGWSETAWSGSGSGCSAQVAKPSWQTDTGCTMRSEADIAAVADPQTGVSVYDSYQSAGWQVVGGTSASSPIIASVYALAGNASTINPAQKIWSDAGFSTFDITSGSNGTCSISYICNAGPGYDGPTGWGTPNGVGAF